MTNQADQPLVAIIGPTNAGKSTLFNRLTGSWLAITAREESTTRDRVYGEVEWQGHSFGLVDTGGLASDESELYKLIHSQTLQAVNEADLILFVYDSGEGLQGQAKEFLNSLRGKKTMWLVANKVDSFNKQEKIEKLTGLGLPYYEISAATGRGTGDLLDDITHFLPRSAPVKHSLPMIALVGRPNVGKSTLLNALTKSDRSVVSPVAGTTRDIVTDEITINNQRYLLADTAGVRRRGQITMGPESFSVKRTLTAISQSDAVLVLVDATIGTTRGDMHLVFYATELNKPVLLVFNKTDLLEEQLTYFKKHLQKKFAHVAISAKEGTNISQVADWITANATKN